MDSELVYIKEEEEMAFSIEASDLHWIHGTEDDPRDICLHGSAETRIGGRTLAYDDVAVSAAGLYLLKTLTEDHCAGEGSQMLPHCGHFLVPDEAGESVTNVGCDNGVDWTVRHEGDDVILELADGTAERLPLAAYREEVFRFADGIEAYYRSCAEKQFGKGEDFEKQAYRVFWKEWRRRRNGGR